jgi:hypothetical protein
MIDALLLAAARSVAEVRPRMDMRGFQIPVPERPQPRRSAVEFIKELNTQLILIENQKKPGQAVRVSYAGTFGVIRAIRVSPEGSDFLSVQVKDGQGKEHTIVAPVFQCSFMFSLFTPTAEEPDERVVLGFAEART